MTFQYRAEYSVPQRLDTILKAIEERDFQTFAEITIKDSNQMHAVCQVTPLSSSTPPPGHLPPLCLPLPRLPPSLPASPPA